jgi:hypothetical protein
MWKIRVITKNIPRHSNFEVLGMTSSRLWGGIYHRITNIRFKIRRHNCDTWLLAAKTQESPTKTIPVSSGNWKEYSNDENILICLTNLPYYA